MLDLLIGQFRKRQLDCDFFLNRLRSLQALWLSGTVVCEHTRIVEVCFRFGRRQHRTPEYFRVDRAPGRDGAWLAKRIAHVWLDNIVIFHIGHFRVAAEEKCRQLGRERRLGVLHMPRREAVLRRYIQLNEGHWRLGRCCQQRDGLLV